MILLLLSLISLQTLSAVHTPPPDRRTIRNYSQKLKKAFANNTGNDLYHTFPPAADALVHKYGRYFIEKNNGQTNEEYIIPCKIRSSEQSQLCPGVIRLLMNCYGMVFHRELTEKPLDEILAAPIFEDYRHAIKEIEFPLNQDQFEEAQEVSTADGSRYIETKYGIFFAPDINNKRMELVLYKPHTNEN
jgi:hypothetical protein